MVRAAAVLAWVLGLGFGLPCVYATWFLADRGFVWTFMGFPTYDAGPLFEDVGLETTVPLLVAFLLVCIAEIVVGVMLWQRRRAGALFALGLVPVEFIFWIGLVLPLGLCWAGADCPRGDGMAATRVSQSA